MANQTDRFIVNWSVSAHKITSTPIVALIYT